MRTLTEESSNVMRNAVSHGVVDTVIHQLSPRSIPAPMFEWVVNERAIEPQNPNTFELQEHPKSLRYHESVMDVATQTDIGEYYAVELAQFPVPKGRIGFIETIEQVLNDVDGNYYPSNVNFWGSPNFVIPDVDDCRWYLNLDYYDGTLPTRYALSSASAISSTSLPGYPYTELHEIKSLWFPAHNKKHFKLLVPGQRVLRFFFLTPPTAIYRWQAMGKLRGYTQSTYSKEAALNARLTC